LTPLGTSSASSIKAVGKYVQPGQAFRDCIEINFENKKQIV
jgi:hypothetical protein